VKHTVISLVIDVLFVWRITHLMQAESGPWNLIVRLRRLAGQGFWGGLLDCFYCLSLWVSIVPAILTVSGWESRFLLCPALSGGAILLERVTASRKKIPVEYIEDEEQEYVLR
jgi:hypothetical protein